MVNCREVQSLTQMASMPDCPTATCSLFMGVSELILPVRTALHSVTSSAVTAQKIGQGRHSPAHKGEPSLGLALHRMQIAFS